MASEKFTGTLKGKELTISGLKDKSKTTIDIDLSATSTETSVLFSTADAAYTAYASDVTKITSTYAKGINLITNKAHTALKEVELAKGADTIYAAVSGLKVTTGAGKDIILVGSDTTNLTLSDFDAKNDVIQLGTGTAAVDGSKIVATTIGGKDIKITIGTNANDDNNATMTLKNALGQKVTIKNGTGAIIYEDTTTFSDDDLKTITDASAGATVKSASKYIDASGRKKAITIYASTETGNAPATQVIIGGAAADSIHATAGQNASVTSGKGADYIYIDSSTSAYTVTVTDYTVGDAKGADKVVFGAGLTFDTVKSGYQTEGDLKGHIVLFGTGTTTEKVTVDLGTSAVWNQTKPVETKALVFAIDSKGTVSAAYSNPAELVITDKKVKYDAKKPAETIIDLGATIGSAKTDTIALGTADKPIDTDTTRAFNFSNIAGPIYLKNTTIEDAPIDIVGSKGKDTLIGAGGATLDGSAGNDLIIAGAADTGTGGAGNDTLRGNSTNSYLTGGAGNDVFALAGAGGIITDYYSGRYDATDTKDSNKASKKELGSDKLVVSYDKFNANGALGRYQVESAALGTASGTDSKQSDLTIAVTGQVWVAGDTVTAKDAVDNYWTGYVHTTYTQGTGAIKYFQDGTPETDASSSTQVFVAGHFEDDTDGTYTLKNALGKAVTFVTEGTTYQQTVDAGTDFTGLKANFHAALAPNATVISADASANKNLKLVGGTKTKVITGGKKNDTLVGNSTNTTLTGGAGNDVYMGTGYISDYNVTGKDKIAFTSDLEDTAGHAFTGIDFVTNDSGDVTSTTEIKAGNLTIKLGSGDITFNNIYNVETQAKLKSGATATTSWKVTEKKVTDAMIRGFGTASSVVAFAKGSTHAFVGGYIDSGVAVIDASKTGKNTYIVNNADYVQSIVGSAKNDSIRAGSFTTLSDNNAKYYGSGDYISGVTVTNSQVTVSTGKGNDIIYVDEGAAYITDFQATKATTNRSTGAVTKITGDALYFSSYATSDVAVASTQLGTLDESTGRKVQGATENIQFTFDGDDVIIGSTTLKGMKGKQAYIYTGADANGKGYIDDLGYASNFATLAAGNMATLSNLAEFTASGNDYKNGKTLITGAKGVNDNANVKESDVYIINASAVSAAAIDMGKYVTKVTAGKGIDTIYAGQSLNLGKSGDQKEASSITSGAGADFIVFDAASISSGATYTLTDYSADKLVLNGLSIKGAEIGAHTGETATVKSGKGNNAVTVYTSDVTLTLTNGKAGDDAVTATVHLVDQSSITGYKVTQADKAAKNANSFSLTYGASDITVAAADGNVIDLTGAGLDNKLNVNVGATRTKAVTITGGAASGFGTSAASYTNIFGTTSKGAITYISGTDSTKGVTFYGSNKADMYIGNAQSDVVVFTAGGNNSIMGGGFGTSSFTFGSGNETAYVKASDTFIVKDYTAGKDVFVLDTVYGAAGDLVAANYEKANGNTKAKLTLTFGTNAADATYAKATSTNSQVVFEDYTAGDKITVKFSTAKNNKVAATQLFQLGFGTDISYADADGTTINAQFVADATKIAAADTKVKKAHVLTVGTNATTKVTEMVGGAGNDTLIANYGVVSLTGGKGNDTFQIDSDVATLTITDFNTGKDVLKFGTGVADANFISNLKDYSAGYDIADGKVTLHYKTAADGATSDVVLVEATANTLVKNGVTTEINIDGTKVKLSDKVDVKVAKTADAIDANGDFAQTKTFDASANNKGVTNTSFGNALTSYKGSTGNDVVTFDSTASVAVAFTGGTDVYTNAGSKASFSLSNSAWVVSGATVETGTNKLTATLTIKNGTKANAAEVGKITVDDSVFTKVDGYSFEAGSTKQGALTFSISTSTIAGSDVKGNASGVAGWASGVRESDTYSTTVYYRNYNVAVAGISGTFQYGSIAISTAAGSKKSAYTEAQYDENNLISYGDTLYGSSEFDAITTPTTSIDISSLDFSTEAVGGFKAGDLTLTTNLTKKQTK